MSVNTRTAYDSERSPATQPRRSHWEKVYRDTRQRILTLELAPGSSLSEISVAREFGISATPARDALGRLCQEGLVVVGPGRGYSVAGLSISDVAQLAEARYVVESGIVQVAIRRARPDQVAHIRTIAQRLEESDLDFGELIERNQDFHIAVAELTGNRRLIDMLRRVVDDSRRIFHLGITALPVEEMIGAHRRLIDAIESKDVVAALVVCEQEAYGTSERVVAQLIRGGADERGPVGAAPRIPTLSPTQ